MGGLQQYAWRQGLREISSTAKHRVGSLRVEQDGRKFRYAYAGSTALGPGKFCVGASINAAHYNETNATAYAIGSKTLTLTVTAGAAIAENALRGGQLQINDETGEGYYYTISSNTAMTAAGTSINVVLDEPIKVALDTTSEFTLVHNPWYGVVVSATLNRAAGAPLVAVTANYYCWLQTGGLGMAWIDGTPADGSLLQQSNGTAGELEIYATGTITYPAVAQLLATGIDTNYMPVFWMID